MRIRVVGLALPVVIGMTVAVSSCGGTTVTVKPAASSSPAPVPAGYRRVGGAAAGISLAVPASWVAIDPTKESKESMSNAASKLAGPGLSAAVLVQDLETMQKLHGILVVDARSVVDDPNHFARILDFFCAAIATTDTGSAGVPLLRTGTAYGFQQIGVTHVTQKDVEVGGVPGVESSFQLASKSAGTIYKSQLEVLPKPHDECFVTLSWDASEPSAGILSVVAATAQFP